MIYLFNCSSLWVASYILRNQCPLRNDSVFTLYLRERKTFWWQCCEKYPKKVSSRFIIFFSQPHFQKSPTVQENHDPGNTAPAPWLQISHSMLWFHLALQDLLELLGPSSTLVWCGTPAQSQSDVSLDPPRLLCQISAYRSFCWRSCHGFSHLHQLCPDSLPMF